MQETFNTVEAAAYIGVHESYISPLVRSGKLKCTDKDGRNYQFLQEHLDDYLHQYGTTIIVKSDLVIVQGIEYEVIRKNGKRYIEGKQMRCWLREKGFTNLKSILAESGITQAELAHGTNIKPYLISLICNDVKHNCTYKTMKRICDYLGEPIESVFGDKKI